ncbi:MAG: murF [Clostridiales bacterium]|jgi:UDP-N-acetylmuramoyl-tripeptide--D-alanyl-D-alanine ligase|nr:murF [Clostridiales bacterium]
MTINEIAEAVSGELVNGSKCHFEEVSKVCTDSRKIDKGQLFIPIVGENFDGHDFIEAVYEKGAAIVISDSFDKIPEEKPAIIVKDTKEALWSLAAYQRRIFNKPVVAITGSVGKTSCKEMLSSILSKRFKVHKTNGNYNNDIGLPLTILELTEDADIMVLEMGMNHFGEIDLLSAIAKPDFAIITNIGVAHIENLGSREGIFKAKTEVISHINKKGLLAVNGDDDLLITLEDQLEQVVTTFGFNQELDYAVLEYDDNGFDGVTAIIKSPLEVYQIKINALGKHMLYHALSGIVIAEIMNMSKEEIEAGILDYIPEKMRLNTIEFENQIIVINDAYNASVDSMKSSLEILSKVKTKGRKVAILGDMFEMGSFAEEGHRKVGEYASTQNIDLLICVGTASKWMYEEAIKQMEVGKVMYYGKQVCLHNKLNKIIMKNDVVLVKASRGMKLELTIEKIKEV